MGRTRMPYTFRRMQVAANNWLDRIHPDPLLVAARKVYKGELETKWDTLSQYDFVLCFENTVLPGWLTEKLFDNLRVGTIPIYWGATDIGSLVPADCYIDMRDFAGYPELKAYLKSLDRKRSWPIARRAAPSSNSPPLRRSARRLLLVSSATCSKRTPGCA